MGKRFRYQILVLVLVGLLIPPRALSVQYQCETFPGDETGTEYDTGQSPGGWSNCNYNSIQPFTCLGDCYTPACGGPLRAGFWATSSTTTRASSGAGYYGNMELSGNVQERTVTVGNSAGLAFSGTHGDGVLSSVTSYEGNATNIDWPGIDATSQDRGVTAATGIGSRGCDWNCNKVPTYTQVSNRMRAATTLSARVNTTGGRLGRTAP